MFRMPVFKAIILFSFGFYRILEFRKRAITNGVVVNKMHHREHVELFTNTYP